MSKYLNFSGASNFDTSGYSNLQDALSNLGKSFSNPYDVRVKEEEKQRLRDRQDLADQRAATQFGWLKDEHTRKLNEREANNRSAAKLFGVTDKEYNSNINYVNKFNNQKAQQEWQNKLADQAALKIGTLSRDALLKKGYNTNMANINTSTDAVDSKYKKDTINDYDTNDYIDTLNSINNTKDAKTKNAILSKANSMWKSAMDLPTLRKKAASQAMYEQAWDDALFKAKTPLEGKTKADIDNYRQSLIDAAVNKTGGNMTTKGMLTLQGLVEARDKKDGISAAKKLTNSLVYNPDVAYNQGNAIKQDLKQKISVANRLKKLGYDTTTADKNIADSLKVYNKQQKDQLKQEVKLSKGLYGLSQDAVKGLYKKGIKRVTTGMGKEEATARINNLNYGPYDGDKIKTLFKDKKYAEVPLPVKYALLDKIKTHESIMFIDDKTVNIDVLKGALDDWVSGKYKDSTGTKTKADTIRASYADSIAKLAKFKPITRTDLTAEMANYMKNYGKVNNNNNNKSKSKKVTQKIVKSSKYTKKKPLDPSSTIKPNMDILHNQTTNKMLTKITQGFEDNRIAKIQKQISTLKHDLTHNRHNGVQTMVIRNKIKALESQLK